MKGEEEKEYQKEEIYKLEIKISKKKKDNSEYQIKYDFSLQRWGGACDKAVKCKPSICGWAFLCAYGTLHAVFSSN